MAAPAVVFDGLIVLDPAALAEGRQRLAAADAVLQPAAGLLRDEAAAAVGAGPFSIVGKRHLPPSGDPHDYQSLGIYWWPNPATPNGLPYVRRDGQVNPETAQYDRPALHDLARTVTTLALAWTLLDEAPAAARAALLLEHFFVAPATRMNPHLNYGQAIPGICTGRGIGIIETALLATDLVDAIGLLRTSPAFRPELWHGLRAWFGAYLEWLLTSPTGHDEARTTNNHGTAYDLQVAVFAMFVDRPAVARETLDGVFERRLAKQIQPDGRQPEELSRTLALSYATMNAALYADLAAVAAKLGGDLWQQQTPDGRGLRRALDWLLPFWTQQAPFAYQQIRPFEAGTALALLRRAGWAYHEPAYHAAAARLPEAAALARHRANLLYPPPA